MHRLTTLFTITALAIAPVALNAADWPRFLGPNGNGFSPEKGVKSLKSAKMLWKVSLSNDGYAGPSVAGGKVYIIDHQGNNDVLRAINIKTGKDVWKFSYGDNSSSNYGFARSTPTVDGSRIYAIGRLGQLHCVNIKTGKKIWFKNFQSTFNGVAPKWQYAMSPFIDGNKIIVCPGGPNAAVAAIDKVTGKTIWQGGGSDIPGYATPVPAKVGGTKLYVVFTGVSLIGVNANNGKLCWRIPWSTSYDVNGATPIVMGNKAFITSGYGHGAALVEFTASSAKIRWENKDLQSRFGTPLLYKGFMYCTEDSGNLVCMSPASGKVRWKQPGFEWGPSTGMVDGNALVFDGKGGDLVMVKLSPDKYQEIGRFNPLGGQSWTAPVISNGKLIVRNKSALACFSLK